MSYAIVAVMVMATIRNKSVELRKFLTKLVGKVLLSSAKSARASKKRIIERKRQRFASISKLRRFIAALACAKSRRKDETDEQKQDTAVWLQGPINID